MVVKGGKYDVMWSEGGWTGPDYAVAYAVGSTPFGPFERVGKILQQDSTVATGAGHHSILHAPGSPNWYIVYHRRPLGETDRNHPGLRIHRLDFGARGRMETVGIPRDGVRAAGRGSVEVGRGDAHGGQGARRRRTGVHPVRRRDRGWGDRSVLGGRAHRCDPR